MLHVIPRVENDNINLQWQPKQLTEEEMSTVELKIKEQTKNIGSFKAENAEKVVQEPEPTASSEDDEDDYFGRQLNRVP